jgi:4'-phosphopantetheinyl transferase
MNQIESTGNAQWGQFMTDGDDNRVKKHFAANSQFLTPEAVSDAARMLYAPVSQDPEVTRLCSSVLSEAELHRAERFAKKGDRDLFIQRRAFRRFCAAAALGSSQPLSQIEFDETENGRPRLACLPELWFSFSSCRIGFVGAWSSTHGIGVDIEDQTRDLEAAELAQQFFSVAEARAVEGPAGLTNPRTFFQFWCLKEAALKSIGEGLPFGLDAFEFELAPNLRVVHAPLEHGGPERFHAYVIEGIDGCIALVTRNPGRC